MIFLFFFWWEKRKTALGFQGFFFNDTHAEWEPLKKKENNKRELTNSTG